MTRFNRVGQTPYTEFQTLPVRGAELPFEVISQCYERGSIIIISNLPFDEWTEVFDSERLTGALLDQTSLAASSCARKLFGSLSRAQNPLK